MNRLFCLCTVLLSGCATQANFSSPTAPAAAFDAPPSPPAANAAVGEAKASPDTIAVVRAAEARVSQTRRVLGRFTDADNSLQLARQARLEGNNPRAQSLARQASARADYALQSHYTRKAAAQLQALYATTGLSDAQLGQLRAAEAALIRGESSLALTRLGALRQQAVTATQTHTVARGETLSGIAARSDVYGNSLLWPLIWQANKASLPDPHHLRAGQVLVIRPHPSVEEVVKAIEFARQNSARILVGQVVPAQP